MEGVLAIQLVCVMLVLQTVQASNLIDYNEDQKLEIKVNLGKDNYLEAARETAELESGENTLQVQGGRQRFVGDQYNYYGLSPDNYQQRRPTYIPYGTIDNNVPYAPRPGQNPYYYPEYVVPARQYWPYPPTTTTTTTTTTPSPIRPIGYMLMDTYQSKRGSFTRPVAYFTT